MPRQNIVKQKKERKNLAKVDNAQNRPNNTILHTECQTELLTLQCPRMVHCAVSTPELLPTLCYDPSQGRLLIWELKRNKINSLCLLVAGWCGIYPAVCPCAVWVIRYELSLTPPTQHSNYKFRALITEFTLQIAHYFTFLHTLQACSIFYQFILFFY